LTVGFGLIFEGNKRGPGNLRGSTWLATLSVGLGIYLFLLLKKKKKKRAPSATKVAYSLFWEIYILFLE
jgi:hypothetical protein